MSKLLTATALTRLAQTGRLNLDAPISKYMTGLPERPSGTMLAHFPTTVDNGVFAFYRRVFETGEAGHYDLNYQGDGLDNYIHVAARRSGAALHADRAP